MTKSDMQILRDAQRLWKLDSFNKLATFYVEAAEEWNALSAMVLRLTIAQKRPVTYLTADPTDPVLNMGLNNLNAFYVGNGIVRRQILATLKSKVVVMTKPHLDAFKLPKSRWVPEYILVLPNLCSVHTQYTTKQLKMFTTILCAGPHQIVEIKELMGNKKIDALAHGSSNIDMTLERVRRIPKEADGKFGTTVLVSGQSQKFYSKVEPSIVRVLLSSDFRVKFHVPYDLKNRQKIVKDYQLRYEREPAFQLSTNETTQALLSSSHALVTDTSPIGYEFALGTLRPTLFMDIPLEFRSKSLENRRPFELALREDVGRVVSLKDVGMIPKYVEELLEDARRLEGRQRQLRESVLFNPGHSATMAAAAIEARVVGADPDEALDRALQELRQKGKLSEEEYEKLKEEEEGETEEKDRVEPDLEFDPEDPDKKPLSESDISVDDFTLSDEGDLSDVH